MSAFGVAVKATLSNVAITGEPEEQLRSPLVTLVKAIAAQLGSVANDTELVGETRLADLMIRPDFAVTRKGALIGFIEVKAPGKGADPNKLKGKHDEAQWKKLKALPNLIYTDGNAFSLWRDGKLALPIVTLDGDVETSGKALKAPPELAALFGAFYDWDPIPPRTPRQLAETAARLCRLLRDEVAEQLERKAPGLTSLKEDWRKLLFPQASDAEFADGYAQAVTFGLLMAKARGISLKGGIEDAARTLRRSNSLIGSALRLLTEEVGDAHTLDTSLKTLTAVLDVVDWDKLSKGEPEAWLYFYELFLQQYDTALRKRTGSYYTPPEVVTAMVGLVDEALRSPRRFDLPQGLASSDVTLVDPAVGTGTFLLGVLQRIRRTVEDSEGAGSVPAAITAALGRLIGFELQFGPFAVAQLRVLAELIDLVSSDADGDDASEALQKALSADLKLYITDTLADPDEETAWIPSNMAGVAESRRKANHIKRHEPITVVIGNPPYKEKAKGLRRLGRGSGARACAHAVRRLAAAGGLGRRRPRQAPAEPLRLLLALGGVEGVRRRSLPQRGGQGGGRGLDPAQGDRLLHHRLGLSQWAGLPEDARGPAARRRRDLGDRLHAGGPSAAGQASRIFEGVQQPVCIVLALRRASADWSDPLGVIHLK